MRVTFYTLGCKVNQNETGALAQLFEENGYTVVSNEEGADVYIVNSCTVTNFGDQKSRKWLRRAILILKVTSWSSLSLFTIITPLRISSTNNFLVI